jgi:hypothetical protein
LTFRWYGGTLEWLLSTRKMKRKEYWCLKLVKAYDRRSISTIQSFSHGTSTQFCDHDIYITTYQNQQLLEAKPIHHFQPFHLQ